MRIVVPVSAFDNQTAPNWVKVIKHLRCGRNHSLHLVSPRSAEALAASIQEQMLGEFDDVRLHVMESEPIGGWPFGPNTQFHACASFMQQDNPRIPWMLCEFDCLPLRSNSFDALASRYSNAGTPFLGKLQPTFWRDDSGKITSSLFGKDDSTMSGCSVYPGDLLTRRWCAALMADLMKGSDESNGAPSTGYDVHIRYGVRKEGVSDAGSMFADNWNTINYRIENGKIVCDKNPGHEIYRRNPTFEIRQTNKPVGFDAMFIHGCKDKSLADLIINDQLPLEAISPKAPAEVTVAGEANQDAGQMQSKLDQMQEMLAKQQEVIAALLAKQAEEKPKKPKEKELEAIRQEVAEKMEAKPAMPDVSMGEVYKFVEASNRSVRLSEVVKQFNMTPEQAREFIPKVPGLQLGEPPVYWVKTV